MPIEDFLDVDFVNDPHYVFGDLGVPKFEEQPCSSYGDEVPVLPESQWKGFSEQIQAAGGGCAQLVSRIYNQKNEGSCVANACSQAHEIVQAKQFGKANVVHLSAMSLYKRIGSSPNSGAMVSNGLKKMNEGGILPLDDAANRAKFGDHVMPNTGWNTKYPDGWQATAKKFAASEWFVCDTVGELITALLNQHPVVVGRSGHSICYCDVVYKDGILVVKYANSWGDWGDNGFGYDSMNKIRSSANWAFALRSVTVNV